MTALESELTFLRGAKNAANSTILPGSGKHHVNYHIEQYSATDTVAKMHEIMKFFPSMFEVGAKASLSSPYSLVCEASASGTSSGALTVTIRNSGSDSASAEDCAGGNSPAGTFRFLGAFSESSGGQFGSSVATGDFNGDGIEDLAVGEPYYDSAKSIAPGAVYVFYGGASFAGKALASDTADASFYGAEYGEFGSSVAAGDVNGDGVTDLVVGAFEFNNAAGAAYVFYGGTTFAGKDLSVSGVTADASFYGKEAGDYLGYSVATGDVNGDGVTDLVVGAYLNDDAGAAAGAAYVILGKSALGDIDFSA